MYLYLPLDYDDDTLENDIMLIKLARSSSADVVPLNHDSRNPNLGDFVQAVGFGSIDDLGNVYPSVLHQVTTRVVNQQFCSRQYLQEYGSPVPSETAFCAGDADRDSCFGDSGGPLLDETGAQVGITSYGNTRCADPDYPGVYTRVSAYIDWIDEFICDWSSVPPVSCGGEPPEESLDDDTTDCSRPIGVIVTVTGEKEYQYADC